MGYLNIVKRKFEKFLSFSPKNRILFILLFFIYFLFQIVFRIFSYKSILSVSKKTTRAKSNKLSHISKDLDETIKAINKVQNNSLLKSTCLEKSIFLHSFLKFNSINSKIYIGINGEGSNFNSHAWVEYNKKILNDDQEKIKNFKIISNIG